MNDALMRKVVLVDSFLEEQFYIKVPLEWLKPCVQSLINLRSSNGFNKDDCLKSRVFKAWLDSDLRETGCDRLPLNLIQQQSIVIDGSFNLQINELRDISQSPYDQLVTLLGQENENAQVTCDPPVFEGKTSRVLLMKITDGSQHLFALEFSPIPELSVQSKPGTKIRAIRPIECHAGYLMLTKDNILVYGGEVECLLNQNGQRNVLNRALNLPEVDERVTNIETNTTAEIVCENGDDNIDVEFLLNDTQDDFFASNEQLLEMEEQRALSSNSSLNESSLSTNNRGETPSINTASDSRKNSISSSSVKRLKLSRNKQGVKQRTLNDFLSQSGNNKNSACNNKLSDVESKSTKNTQDVHPFFKKLPSKPALVSKVNGEPSATCSTCVLSIDNIDEPYTYLSKALKNSITQPKIVYVKAFIVTFLNKLKRNLEKREWQLKVLINDGTMTLEADVSHSILRNLIGLDPSHISDKQQLKAGLSSCSQKLAHLNSIMKIELNQHPNPHKILQFEDNIKLDNLQLRNNDVKLSEIGIL